MPRFDIDSRRQTDTAGFKIKFRFEARQYSRSLKTSNEQKANLAQGQIERNLALISLGLLEVPDACDVFDFFLTGKDQEKPSVRPNHEQPNFVARQNEYSC